MDTRTINPRLMPCPHKPEGGLLYRLNGLRNPLLILGLIVLIASIPRGINPVPRDQPNPTVIVNSEDPSAKAHSVIQTADGGFVLAGVHSYYEGIGVWLVKTDASGRPVWNKTYYGGSASSVIQTEDGGFAIGGTTGPYCYCCMHPWDPNLSPNSHDMYLVKTDANGQEEWSRAFGGLGSDIAWSMVGTVDGGFALIGRIAEEHGWLVKTDRNGKMEWNRTLPQSGACYTGIQTADGGFALVAGETLVKTDAFGQEEWNRTIFDAVYFSMTQLTDGGFAIAGGGFVAGLVRTDSTGQEEWKNTYMEPTEATICSVIQTSDGGFVLAGASDRDAGSYYFYLLAKTNPSGQMEWYYKYGHEYVNGQTATETEIMSETTSQVSLSWCSTVNMLVLTAVVISRRRKTES